MLLIIFSYSARCVAMQMVETPGMINARVPCFISPAASASEWM